MPEETTQPDKKYGELVDSYNTACANVEERHKAIEAAKDDPESTEEARDKLLQEFTQAVEQRDKLHDRIESAAELERARKQHKPMELAGSTYIVKEPDTYVEHGEHSFLRDLYARDVKGDSIAAERINRHHQHEIEKRAITSATLGGIIPPAYLVGLYAKASRNGRVFADNVNGQDLPDVGMSLVVPRLTAGLSAAAQTTQNTAVVTSDPTETDLTVNVNTIAGFSPVSRQAIERAAYSDRILFEDLTARYWAVLDTYCINGSGSNNQPLGLLGTSSISTSAASTMTAAGIYPKIADIIQQIAVAVGGLGYGATKIFMHPRRWGFFEASVDSSNRPLIVPSGPGFNAMGTDNNPEADVGLVGNMHGIPVYVDPNIPTNLGTNTNEDRIIAIAHPIVHLWERSNDPVTLSFEQQAGTSLQVQLVCYGYVAFTAGRYPAASGVVTGLTPPTF